MLVVVGSKTSSNSNRLVELGHRAGIPAYLVDGAADLHREWFEGKQSVGVSAGASAPESLVQGVVQHLKVLGATSVRRLDGIQETIKFPLPKGLKIDGL